MERRQESDKDILIRDRKMVERSDDIGHDISMCEPHSFRQALASRSEEYHRRIITSERMYRKIQTLHERTRFFKDGSVFQEIFEEDESSACFVNFEEIVFHLVVESPNTQDGLHSGILHTMIESCRSDSPVEHNRSLPCEIGRYNEQARPRNRRHHDTDLVSLEGFDFGADEIRLEEKIPL